MNAKVKEMISRTRRREEMLRGQHSQYIAFDLPYSCCTMASLGIDIRLNPQTLHFFGRVFQTVVESVLDAEETDLKDQLLLDDETERTGV
jgi:hypothetical protein